MTPLAKRGIGIIESCFLGDFGELDTVRTTYDIAIDDKSPNRKQQLFEKAISGTLAV